MNFMFPLILGCSSSQLTNNQFFRGVAQPPTSYDKVLIELEDGKIETGNPLHFTVKKTQFSCRFSLKPIHWYVLLKTYIRGYVKSLKSRHSFTHQNHPSHVSDWKCWRWTPSEDGGWGPLWGDDFAVAQFFSWWTRALLTRYISNVNGSRKKNTIEIFGG